MSLVTRLPFAIRAAMVGIAVCTGGCGSSGLQISAPPDGRAFDAASEHGSGGSGANGVGGSGVGGSAGADGVDAGRDSGGDAGPLIGSGVALFDTTTEGFAFDGYHDTSSRNLADAMDPVTPPPTLSFDSTQGSPSPGSLQVGVPFSGANQYVEVAKIFGTSASLDWTGQTLHVRLSVGQGTFTGGIQVYVMTGATYAFGGTYSPVGADADWHDFKVDLTAPATRSIGYDPAQVVAFGVQLNSGSVGVGATPVVFNLDSFSISPRLVPDAGSDATTSDASGQ
jgi:hypothetical protein